MSNTGQEVTLADEKAEPKQNKHNAIIAWTIAGISLVSLLIVSYQAILFGGWKFSFTNVNYSFLPFASAGTATSGPQLSDPADNFLPIAFSTFHPLHYTEWLSQIGIGTQQSLNTYLSPLAYFYLLPFDIAQILISMVKLVVAFIAMFMLIRQFGYTWKGALISGISYACCSVMIMWNGWQHSEVTMYAPFIVLLLDKALKSLKAYYFIIFAVVLGLMLLAGMPTYVAYFMYMAGAFALYYGIVSYRKSPKNMLIYFGGFGLAVVFGALLSLPCTGQLLTSVGSNGYAESRGSSATAVLPLSQLKTMFFPYMTIASNVHPNEGTIYAGILAIVTLPLSVINIRKKRVGFFIITGLITMVFVFTHWLDPVYNLLPFVHTSLKYRVLVLLDFSLAVLAGINMDVILNTRFESMRERIKIWVAAAAGIALFVFMAFRVRPLLSDATDAAKTHYLIACVVVAIFAVAVIIQTLIAKQMVSCVCAVSIMGGVVADMGYFSSQYWPLIEKSAPAIPEPTDTVKYLQRNTQNQEKIMSFGTWTLFPQTNMYYGLRDIGGHSFLYTNQDVHSYYTALDSNAFVTGTRTGFQAIDNVNLAKYMGIKYVLGASDASMDMGDRIVPQTIIKPIGPLNGDNVIRQTFVATDNNLSQIRVRLGLYRPDRKTGTATITVKDEPGHIVARSSVSLSKVIDNEMADFSFDAIQDSKGKTYELSVSFDTAGDDTGVAVYASDRNEYQGNLYDSSGAKQPGDLDMTCLYGDVRMGKDGLITRELPEYSNEVQLTDTVKLLDSEADVLNAMGKSYDSSTVYFSKEKSEKVVASSQNSLTSDEKISNTSVNTDGSMSFNVHVNEARYVLINEYNDGSWNAYVDGQKVNVLKGNYLFRAVRIPAGTHRVELRYESLTMHKISMVSAVSAAMLVVLAGVERYIAWRRNHELATSEE
ncbi:MULTISPECIES: YfhO family protein [Bifidobacterium]|uniref:YfhO family protein n=1 Tax=Bifidobacterium TaxID=1678 RepID=UPI0013CF9269|nr:YfhO family protein [Bifidobacterium saimiriisciurei]